MIEPAASQEPVRAPFGRLASGAVVEAVTLASGEIYVRLLSFGASIHSVSVPDRTGALADVALGHVTLDEYLATRQYIGSTVGRVANRIAGGRFRFEGQDYEVPVNNGPNSLHGGTIGFDLVNWEILSASASEAVFRLVSPDGDQGYPGTLTVTATYRLEGDTLSVEYLATVSDRPTLVNLSNHAYWNLAGEGAEDGAMGHLLTLHADHFLPTDATAIPTGEVRPVEVTPFDFRRARPIGARVRDASDEQIRFGRGYDHNWVVARDISDAPRPVARVEHPGSGRVMELSSNQPGVQFYSGNFLDGTTVGKSGKLYRMGDAFVLEPQRFPDTPNHPQFGSLRLAPGEIYRNVIAWRFSVRED